MVELEVAGQWQVSPSLIRDKSFAFSSCCGPKSPISDSPHDD